MTTAQIKNILKNQSSGYTFHMLNRPLKIKWKNLGEWMYSYKGTLLEYMIQERVEVKKIRGNNNQVLITMEVGRLKLEQRDSIESIPEVALKFCHYAQMYLGDTYKIIY